MDGFWRPNKKIFHWKGYVNLLKNLSGVRLLNGRLVQIPHGAVQRRQPPVRRTTLYKTNLRMYSFESLLETPPDMIQLITSVN